MSSKVASGFHTLLFVVVFVCFKTRFQIAQLDPELAMQPRMSLNYSSCLLVSTAVIKCVITPCLIHFFGSCHFFLFITFIIYVCLCVWMYISQRPCRGQRTACRSCAGDHTQIIRIGSKHLYPQDHLAGLVLVFSQIFSTIFFFLIAQITFYFCVF